MLFFQICALLCDYNLIMKMGETPIRRMERKEGEKETKMREKDGKTPPLTLSKLE